MSLCRYSDTLQKCVVSSASANRNRALEKCGTTRGYPGCRCLGTNFQPSFDVNSPERNGSYVKTRKEGFEFDYPAGYG